MARKYWVAQVPASSPRSILSGLVIIYIGQREWMAKDGLPVISEPRGRFTLYIDHPTAARCRIGAELRYSKEINV